MVEFVNMTSNSESTPRHKFYEDVTDILEPELIKVETFLRKKLETLEKLVTLPQEEDSPPPNGPPILRSTQRITSMLKQYTLVEELLTKENINLKKQLKQQQYLLKEIEMERDILLQQVHAHLEANSRLKVRLEEQRCQTGALQRQLNIDLESRIQALEGEKEHLLELNLEKDQKIRKITKTLEGTLKTLKEKETEALNRRNEEINLKAELKKVLEEKTKTEQENGKLKEQLENYLINEKGLGGRRSRSMGDLAKGDKRIGDFYTTHEMFKTMSRKSKATPVQSQLNSLRRDLLNVTKKLEELKLQLIRTGVIPEEVQPPKTLKRKAKPMEEVSEDQKTEFKNLKHILQDAKNLNAKLQNMREEKQKIIEDRRIDGEKENEFSQTTGEVLKTR